MRMTIVVLLSLIFLVACGQSDGGGSIPALPTRAESITINPRTLLQPDPSLPPTWTPPPPIIPEHLPESAQPVEVPVDSGRPPYVVQAGDTLGEIATYLGVSLESLAAANSITNWDVIEVGTVLVIPAS